MLSGLYVSLVSGLIYGIILSLLASGLSLIYGVMNSINTAHGAFYMLGGFLAFLGSSTLRLSPALAILFAFVAALLLGMVTLTVGVRRSIWVTNQPSEQNVVLMELLAIAFIAEEAVFLLFGGSSVSIPSITFGNFLLPGDIYISYQETIAVGICIASYVGLYLFLFHTRIGRAIRAFAEDRELAEGLGVNVTMIALLTYGIGVALAALTGSLLGSIYSVTSESGWNELVIAFVIVTFGGIGSLEGTVIAGLIYGVVYSILEYNYPSLSFVLTLLFIYVILVIRPKGILGVVVERA